MKKIIIKNCPALRFPLKENPICSKMPFEECCKDITNCVMKRIVNECKMNMSDNNFKYILEHKNDEGIIWLADSSKAILNILQLLEIEECENEFK